MEEKINWGVDDIFITMLKRYHRLVYSAFPLFYCCTYFMRLNNYINFRQFLTSPTLLKFGQQTVLQAVSKWCLIKKKESSWSLFHSVRPKLIIFWTWSNLNSLFLLQPFQIPQVRSYSHFCLVVDLAILVSFFRFFFSFCSVQIKWLKYSWFSVD